MKLPLKLGNRLLDISLTVSDELAEQVYEALTVSGYKKSRVLQV